MKKRMLVVLMATLAAMLLGGCAVRSEADVSIDAAGMVSLTVSAGMDDDFFNQYAMYINSMGGQTVTAAQVKEELRASAQTEGTVVTEQVIDGVNYFMMTQTSQNLTVDRAEEMLEEDMSLQDVCLKTDYFYARMESDAATGQLSQADGSPNDQMNAYMRISMVFPAPVVSTNGVIDPANACRVTWESVNSKDVLTFYATTKAATAAAKLTSVKNGKFYKVNQKIQVANAQDVAKMTIQNAATAAEQEIAPGYTVKKSGCYDLTIWSVNGTCQHVSFCLDKKKPTIKGAKNGKTYKKNVKLSFTDDLSGIRSVTVNGKKISAKKYKGYTVKKNGKYKVVVKDKAGNKKVISFKVKK